MSTLKEGDQQIVIRPPPRFFGVGFSLNASQCRKLNRWLKEIHRAVVERQLTELRERNRKGFRRPYVTIPNYGAVGGALSFTFAPNGIGTYCRVTEGITKRSLDLSEYDEW